MVLMGKIRGLDKGTLVLVNGAPMNLLNYNAISNIPLDSIEKIEIVRGSNATLYGAEAMGGVINIITKYIFFFISYSPFLQ